MSYTEKVAQLRDQLDLEAEIALAGIEDNVVNKVHLAQLIREGSTVTEQAFNSWGNNKNTACALSAASIAAQARGL